MYKNNFKNIIKEWNSFLNESISISKIYNQIEKLQEINRETNQEYKIIVDIDNNGKKYYIGYGTKNSNAHSNVNKHLNSLEKKNPELSPPLYGKIEIIDAESVLKLYHDNYDVIVPSKGKDEENSTWFISETSRTKKGMGPLLYEVVIEFVSKELNAGIKPDPFVVSKNAEIVWTNYMNRSDITSKQLDISPNDIPAYENDIPAYKKSHVKSGRLQPLTKDIKSDDTLQFSAIDHLGYDWNESALSKTYKKDNYDIIKKLASLNPPLIQFKFKTNKIKI